MSEQIDQATIEALNAPQAQRWCDRCQCVHAARAAGSLDRHIRASAQALADAIDQRAVQDALGIVPLELE